MKNQSTLIIGLLCAALGLALGYAIWSTLDGKHQPNSAEEIPADMHQMPDGSLMGNGSTDADMDMMRGMDHSSMMVSSEREFIRGMIPHHQEAVDTANEVLERGGSTPEIKKLAQDIITAQETEIAMMKEWYQAWYNEVYVQEEGDYQLMMRDLENLHGAALDAVFLEDMIPHHMGAIMMAQSVQPYIERTEIRDLTKAIAESQTAEIELMQRLLGGL